MLRLSSYTKSAHERSNHDYLPTLQQVHSLRNQPTNRRKSADGENLELHCPHLPSVPQSAFCSNRSCSVKFRPSCSDKITSLINSACKSVFSAMILSSMRCFCLRLISGRIGLAAITRSWIASLKGIALVAVLLRQQVQVMAGLSVSAHISMCFIVTIYADLSFSLRCYVDCLSLISKSPLKTSGRKESKLTRQFECLFNFLQSEPSKRVSTDMPFRKYPIEVPHFLAKSDCSTVLREFKYFFNSSI